MTTTFRAATIATLLLATAGCAEDTLRLRARLATTCAVGDTELPSPTGGGSVGVNTTFRAAPTATMMDRNILDVYFYDPEDGRDAGARSRPPGRAPCG